jgi:uncharacterized phiE125 gp8 family phage protein
MTVEAGAPTLPAVALEEAKAYLRIEGEAEDALVAGLIRAAYELCEAFTGQALIARSFRETIPAQAEWRRLGRTPVRAITGIEGLPVDAYAVDIDANGDGWARVIRPGAGTRAIVTFEAGMATEWNGVPEPVRQGIVRLVAHLFAHRDAAGDAGPPAAVAALWRPWRRMRLK